MATEEDDAQKQLVESLRGQLTDLLTQVGQLNSKLVKSYNRISDLEDELHDSTDTLSLAKNKLKDLEERVGSHQNALLTGSLVNREEITAELSRVMERATEEASQRGLAEEAKEHIEKEIGDLSESLFSEAHRMVRTARQEQAESERRMREMEKEVRMAETAVVAMQTQLQERINVVQQAVVQNGGSRQSLEWKRPAMDEQISPYTQFLTLLSHIRSLKLTATTPNPILSSLLSQPFIARIVAEDSEPTLRLETAPSLNWITRRTLLNTVYTGQLDISPAQFQSSLYNLSSSGSNCALCGVTIHHPSSRQKQTQLHTFRLPSTAASFPGASSSLSSSSSFTSPTGTIYLLCASGYCLNRLRSTITLWSYIRSAVIEHIWNTAPILAPPPSSPLKINGIGIPPPVPPRRRSIIPTGSGKGISVSKMSMSGLWGALRRTDSSGSVDEKSSPSSSNGKKNTGGAVDSPPPSPTPSRIPLSTSPKLGAPPLPRRASRIATPDAASSDIPTQMAIPSIEVNGVHEVSSDPPAVIVTETSATSTRPTSPPTSPPSSTNTAVNGILVPPPRSRARARSGTVSASSSRAPPVTATGLPAVGGISEEQENGEALHPDGDAIESSHELESKPDPSPPKLENTTPTPDPELPGPTLEAEEPVAPPQVSEEMASEPPKPTPESQDTVTPQTSETATTEPADNPESRKEEHPEKDVAPAATSSSVPPSPTGSQHHPPPIPRRAARRAAPRPLSTASIDIEKKEKDVKSEQPLSVVAPVDETEKPASTVDDVKEEAPEVKTEIVLESKEKDKEFDEEKPKDPEPGHGPEVIEPSPEEPSTAEKPPYTSNEDAKVDSIALPKEDDSTPTPAQAGTSHDTPETSTPETEPLTSAVKINHELKEQQLTASAPDVAATPLKQEDTHATSSAPAATPPLVPAASSQPPPPPPRHPRTVPSAAPLPPAKSDKPLPLNGTEEQDGELSWEKKTYQEIVRLRTEMFWARIGVESGAVLS